MTVRLETIAPDLVEKLTKADSSSQRKVAIAAAESAVARTRVSAPEIDRAFATARAGEFGDSPARYGVQSLTDRLDEEQWAIQERADSGQATPTGHLEAFSAARASSAVYYALDADTEKAALETLYEANAAIDDLEFLRRLVSQRLGG